MIIKHMNVVITGKNGYIGTSISKRLQAEGYQVKMLDMRSDEWKKQSFAGTDVVIHCAALVHAKQGEYSFDDYYKVNVTLTEELARKAKAEGVRRFCFISSIAVYGVGSSCFSDNIITPNTPVLPKTDYGVTKAIAEQKLLQMDCSDFSVLILRLPFVYGKGCPGNYQSLRKLILKVRVIPTIKNQISMIYIGNLTEFLCCVLARDVKGIFIPQNSTIHSTDEMASLIARYNAVKVLRIGLFNPLIKLLSLGIKQIRTAFGNEVCSYELGLQGVDSYEVVDFEESLRLTESGK